MKKSRNVIYNIIIVLIATIAQSRTSQGCTIINVSNFSNTSDSISLSWDLSTECSNSNFRTFQITARHRKFLSCDDETNNSVTTFETSEHSITLKNLHPFSLYRIGIVGIGQSNVETNLEISTPSGVPHFRPKRSDQFNFAVVQAITFHWAESDRDSCRLRNGRPSGYRVELWGDDPWVSSNRPLAEKLVPEHLPLFYAVKLFPFTRYRLKVFILNADNSYNVEMPLELTERTLPSTPGPPEEVRADPVSPTSVHLRWNPKYPPNGKISVFTVRIGSEESENFNWRKRIEFLPSDSRCNRGSVGIALQVCYVVTDLTADTLYTFQVQVTNENVSTPSLFSANFVAKTQALPPDLSITTTVAKDPSDNSPTPTPTSTSTWTSIASTSQEHSSQPQEPANFGTTKTLIIVFTLIAIVVVVVISFAFVYKIKIKKLKLRFQHGQISGPESYISVQGFPPGRSVSFADGISGSNSVFGTGHRSKSISGQVFGPACIPGLMSGPPSMSGGMSTANFIHSVANQIEEIQSRRLPEPPPVKTIHEETDEEEAYVQIENSDSGNGTLVSRFRNARPTDSQNESFSGPMSEDDSTDVYGYLKPTFHRFSTGSELGFSTTTLTTSPPEPIPIESYSNFGETALDNPLSSVTEINSNNLVLTSFDNQVLTGFDNQVSTGSAIPDLTGLTGSNSDDTTDSSYDVPRSFSESNTSQENRREIRPLIMDLEPVQV